MAATRAKQREQTLDEQVRDLARIRLLIEPQLDDERRAAEGSKTFYAVDANIVQFYLDPENRGPAEPGRRFADEYGYSTVFQNDPPEVSSALGMAVSHHIMFHLTGSDPCLLLPGHNEEVFRFYDELTRLSYSLKPLMERQVEVVSQAFERLLDLEQNASAEDIESGLGEITEGLFEALHDPDNDRQRLTRLSALLKDGRLRSIDSGAHEIVRRNAGAEAAKAFDTAHEGLALGVFRHGWSERMSAIRPERSLKVENDKQALARLEHINFRLSNTGHRLVLITGDHSIHEAASQYPLEDGKTFRDLYVRHPSAYLASPTVLRADDASVVNWMDPIFSKVTDFNHIPIELLKQLAAQEIGLAPRHKDALAMAQLIRDEWRTHTAKVVTAHRSASEQMRDSIKVICRQALSERSKPVAERLKEIDEKLAVLSNRTWDGFFASLTAAGFELFETGSSGRKRNRLPPPIKLNYLPKTQAFVKEVTRRGLREHAGDRATLEAKLKEIREEDGGLGYGLALAFAMLYADKEGWQQARMLAERAIALSRPMQHGVCRGREAYFLQAVACRMLATKSEDFAQCREALANARRIAAIDRIELPDGPTFDFRFDVEEMAIELSRCILELNKLSAARAPEVERAAVIGDLARLLQTLVAYYETKAEPGWEEFGISRALLVKIFIAHAVLEHSGAEVGEGDFVRLARTLDMLVPKTGDASSALHPSSEIVSMIHNYTLARFGELTSGRRRKLMSDTQNMLRRLSRKNPDYLLKQFSRPYDKWEYGAVLNETLKCLERAKPHGS